MTAGAIDEILIDHLPGETRVALLGEGRLVALGILRPGQESRVGAVVRGRVTAVRRDQGAAYVDIGLGRAGFLSLKRGVKPPVQGAMIVAQVVKDAVDDKGPGLSDRPLVVGRLLTLRPGQPGLERSRRLAPDDFARAAKALKGVDAQQDGFLVNPWAADAGDAALVAEAEALRDAWLAAAKQPGAPKTLLPAPDPLLRAVLDNAATLKAVLADDAETLNRLRAGLRTLAPDLAALPQHHAGPQPLFRRHDAEAQIEEALSPRVRLPGGGALTIDELASMTVIDVDMAAQQSAAGQEQAALAANLEAAGEIARQLRLRDIGGIAVVDFLRVGKGDNRRRVVEALRRASAGDPQQVDVLGMTPAGLVELTRRRGRPSLRRMLRDDPLAAGFALLRAAMAEAVSRPGRKLTGRAAPAVVAALAAEAATLAHVRARIGAALELEADPAQPARRFELVAG
ncbi:MAG: ribonuclease E/G [Rhodospirillales bacterium]